VVANTLAYLSPPGYSCAQADSKATRPVLQTSEKTGCGINFPNGAKLGTPPGVIEIENHFQL
jgi:hypothetical protein